MHAYVNPTSPWETARKRVPKQRVREDHIAGRRSNSLSHDNLAHKLVPLLQAMKIRDAKVAVDKGYVGEIEELASVAREESQAQKEVTYEAQNDGTTIHVANPMELCDLKSSELEPRFQKILWSCRTPRRCREGRIWLARCTHWAWILQHLK